MVGYTAIESAVVDKLIATFPDELDSNVCQAGDVDSVFESIFSGGREYGCFFEYQGGRPMGRSPFDNLVFVWRIGGVFLIRYTDNSDVETRLRAIVDKLATLFEHDHTLSGTCPKVYIAGLGEAETAKVGDMPFYWVPFVVEAIDK